MTHGGSRQLSGRRCSASVFFLLNLRCAQITNKRQGACAYYSVVQSESVFSKMFRKIMSIPHSCAFRHLSICGLPPELVQLQQTCHAFVDSQLKPAK